MGEGIAQSMVGAQQGLQAGNQQGMDNMMGIANLGMKGYTGGMFG